MPELPEVETIKRGLVKFLVHKRITKVEVLCEKSFQGPTELAMNQTIIDIRRRGKALLIDLENGITLLIHLRMTGQLIYRSSGAEQGVDLAEVVHAQETPLHTQAESIPAAPVTHATHAAHTGTAQSTAKLLANYSFAGGHPTDSFFTRLPNSQTRVIFTLSDNSTKNREKSQKSPNFNAKLLKTAIAGHLFFNDQRKFGFVKVIPTAEVPDDPFIKSLAPEPWEMSAEDFYRRLQRHPGAPVKAVILDQKVIAGLGNIYADEALFLAKIHPTYPAGSLDATQAAQLLQAARTVMQRSIDSGGSTMATYVRADGTRGNYLELFAQVFRRENQPCPVCGTEIMKIRVAGRGTHVCPNCQTSSKKREKSSKNAKIHAKSPCLGKDRTNTAIHELKRPSRGADQC